MSLKSSLKTVLTLGQGLAVGLPDAAAEADPIELFQDWFAAARESGILLPESMSLATATPDGVPSVRMVLLKAVGEEGGFVFFTNYGSQKAGELDANPRAALCFHWAVLQRQVRVAGRVDRIGREESAEYFAGRERDSQIGAWASRQSQPVASRGDLEHKAREIRERFAGKEVPLPEFWGGYRLAPERIEFWQARPGRLHDRLRFVREGSGWTAERLNP
jgi:pyridoxamine 5'-phosphate oxidase